MKMSKAELTRRIKSSAQGWINCTITDSNFSQSIRASVRIEKGDFVALPDYNRTPLGYHKRSIAPVNGTWKVCLAPHQTVTF